ncbi:MAG: outer membrane lipoprotein carrier protein LolA [Desulfobacterales bacterium]|nr:outer membrane lipoprotein carrier protein LolA [Desulfobacterales bacterium]
MKEKTLQNFLNKCLFVILICSSLASFAIAQETDSTILDQFLEGLEKRYSKNDFRADFSQVSKLKVLEIDEAASGKAMFSHPGKMKWEYLEPQQHQIITNGKMLWIYRPDQNQVIIGDAQAFFKQGAGGAFLSDISIIKEKYIISIKENTESNFVLNLIPKVKTPEIQSILIIVSKKDYYIKKIITSNIYEDTIEIEFHNIEFKDIDESVFELNIPENTNIMDMDNLQGNQ